MSRSYDALVEMNHFHYFLDGLYGSPCPTETPFINNELGDGNCVHKGNAEAVYLAE